MRLKLPYKTNHANIVLDLYLFCKQPESTVSILFQFCIFRISLRRKKIVAVSPCYCYCNFLHNALLQFLFMFVYFYSASFMSNLFQGNNKILEARKTFYDSCKYWTYFLSIFFYCLKNLVT